MAFRTGDFDRTRVGALRPFCPARALVSITEVSLQELKDQGKKLILLDVDHTLVKWKQENFDPTVITWLEEAKALGFQLCILSNTRHPDRLARISEYLKIDYLRGKFKPSREMYLEALTRYSVEPEQAVMIGDQMMTDILGANRSGIDAIWVQKMDGPEFAGTKVNRLIEKIISSILYRSLVTDPTETDTPNTSIPIWERAIFRQFVKFLAVGAISFVIDNGVRWIMMFVLKTDGNLLSSVWGAELKRSFPSVFSFAETPDKAFYPVTAVIGSFLATFNSYLMNRAFTFKVKGREEAGKQLIKVFMVNYVGLAINVGISTIFYSIIPGHPKRSAAIAGVIGAAVAAIWNFAGQRYFAFKVHKR